jgi:peptidoglycan hydrolase-like protein with peptidoglycan-binding domain
MQSPFTDLLPATAGTAENMTDNFLQNELELNNPFVQEMTEQLDYAGNHQHAEAWETGETQYEDLFNSYDTLTSGGADPLLMEGEVNYEKANRSNIIYGQQLRWNFFDIEIYQLLGYTSTSPSPEQLADAVAKWQTENDMPSKDGIIGPTTWTAMFKAMMRKTTFPGTVISSAIPANQKLGDILGWNKYELPIYNVLGFYNETPDAATFAKAIALWQPKWGFTGSNADGRLGEKTWAKIKPLVVQQVTDAQQVNEKAVSYPALIKGLPGIYLHKTPKVSDKQTTKLYAHGQAVTVIALSTIAAEKDWRKIRTQDKSEGWIQSWYLADVTIDDVLLGVSKAPSPYLVKKDDTLDDLVKKYYPDYAIEIGNDRRTIIHAFSILNNGRDSIDYKGESDTWWRDHVLDRDMAETRRIYQTIRLKENKLIYFPGEAFIKTLRDLKIVGVRPDWKNTAITIGKSILGFLEGVGKGFIEAGVDTVTGLWDFIKSLFTGELFSQLYDLYKEFEKYTIGEAFGKVWDLIKAIVGEKVEAIKKDFNHPNPYYKFYSIGKMVGYILFEVVLFILTSGTSLAAKFAAKFGKVAELLSKSATLAKVVNKARPVLRTTVAAWDKAHALYDFVGIGSAIFTAIDSIDSIGVEGGDLSIRQLDQETETDYQETVAFEQDLGDSTGDEAEELVIKALRDGDPLLRQQGIPLFDHIVPGIHNKSGHGIDIFGFSVSGDKVSIYIIEVKGGPNAKLRKSKILGPQMGFSWLSDAIDKALENDTLNKQLKEAFKFYHGKTFSNADIKKMLLKARRNLVVSNRAVDSAIRAIQKLLKTKALKKVGLIKLEVEQEYSENEWESLDMEDDSQEMSMFENQVPPKKPVFVRRLVSGKSYMIFDPASNKAATSLNQQQFTKSALKLADIETALARHVKLADIRQMLESHNKLSPGNPYTIAIPGSGTVDAVFTEAIHQFQVAHYVDVNQQDGIMGRSTLETMGFEDHNLRGTLDSSSFDGRKIIDAAGSSISTETGGKFTRTNWFNYILQPAWLGVKISGGVHALLFRELQKAQTWLLSQKSYAGMTPVDLGKALGVQDITGARLFSPNEAMHGVGLAIDIERNRNPWIGAGWVLYDALRLGERTRMYDLLERLSGTVLLSKPVYGCSPSTAYPSGKKTIFAYLDSITKRIGADTAQVYQEFKQRNDEFVAHVNDPANLTELKYWQNSFTFGNGKASQGFLNLHADLVQALRQVSQLAWGAVDFGPCASGDIMHFDTRTIGIGKKLCTLMKGHVPSAGHPSIASLTPPVTKEWEEEAIQYEYADESEHREADSYVMTEDTEFSEEEQSPENAEEPGYESFLYEMDQQVKDWSGAIRANRKYSVSLGWEKWHDQVNDLLLPFSGQQNMSLGEEAFAEAVAAWQRSQGFSANESDGIIGPKTWKRMMPLLNKGAVTVIAPVTVPTSSTPPPVQQILAFNQWHAQKVLDAMNNGVMGTNFNSKDQLEKIVRGEQVLQVNPNTMIIQVLPLLSHIATEATGNNYRNIIIGSFIRKPNSNGSCTGHCAGRCIDINYSGGNFESAGSAQMVIHILNYLVSLPVEYKKKLGFGMPLQGEFFGHRDLVKYKSSDPSNIRNTVIRQLVTSLGIVFPDNDNHLHIQVGWL